MIARFFAWLRGLFGSRPRLPNPDSREWRDYMDAALSAQFLTPPMPVNPLTHEPHPVTDGMEEE